MWGGPRKELRQRQRSLSWRWRKSGQRRIRTWGHGDHECFWKEGLMCQMLLIDEMRAHNCPVALLIRKWLVSLATAASMDR